MKSTTNDDDDDDKSTTKQRQHYHHVVVVVLGDVGRSPRMQYHALSLLEQQQDDDDDDEIYYVSLVGYEGEDLIPDLQRHITTTTTTKRRLNIVRFSVSSPPNWVRKMIPPLYYLWRLLSLIFGLLYALCIRVPRGNNNNVPVTTILVQNPPAIPTLFIAWAYCFTAGIYRRIITTTWMMTKSKSSSSQRSSSSRRRPRFIIDWHNLGSTMFREGSILSKLTRYLEEDVFAPLADGHLCVTQAMKDYLTTTGDDDGNGEEEDGDRTLLERKKTRLPPLNNNNTNIRVLYDCPPTMFRPLSIEEQHEFMMKLDLASQCPKSWWLPDDTKKNNKTQTLFTEEVMVRGGKTMVRPRIHRPALVTSSTSWTEDEDFGILLDALVALQKRLLANNNNNNNIEQRILVCVTGKGPQKEQYEERISQLKLQPHICILTLWLEPGDYPKLLACADVGISLHTSTSGRDLPMKVLDLFGCETPVCAVNFDCLSKELVYDGVNGRVFTTRDELTNQLYDLLSPLSTLASSSSSSQEEGNSAAPHSFGELAVYSKNLKGRKRWAENWNECARPIVLPPNDYEYEKKKKDDDDVNKLRSKQE